GFRGHVWTAGYSSTHAQEQTLVEHHVGCSKPATAATDSPAPASRGWLGVAQIPPRSSGSSGSSRAGPGKIESDSDESADLAIAVFDSDPSSVGQPIMYGIAINN